MASPRSSPFSGVGQDLKSSVTPINYSGIRRALKVYMEHKQQHAYERIGMNRHALPHRGLLVTLNISQNIILQSILGRGGPAVAGRGRGGGGASGAHGMGSRQSRVQPGRRTPPCGTHTPSRTRGICSTQVERERERKCARENEVTMGKCR